MKKVWEVCINCYFYRDEDSGLIDFPHDLSSEDVGYAECRKNPPSPKEYSDYGYNISWPQPGAHDWCGGFVPRDKVIAYSPISLWDYLEVYPLEETDWISQ